MNLLDDQIKKLEEFSTITPRIAYLFKRLYLNIIESAEEQELDAWLYTSETHDREADQALVQLHNNLASLPQEQRIKDVATFANITLRAIELLHCSRLNVLNASEWDELNVWREESKANACLEARLVDFNDDKSIRETTTLLIEIFVKAHPQDTLAYQVLQWISRITNLGEFPIQYDTDPLPL
jgi:hypothetical protein